MGKLKAYAELAGRGSKRYRKRQYGVRDWELCWNCLRGEGIFETFVAEKNGEMLAGLSVWGFGADIEELWSFQSERSYREKLYGPDLLKWEVMQWARNMGLRQVDLAGISPNPQTEKEAHIRQFKEKWGGTYSEYTVLL